MASEYHRGDMDISEQAATYKAFGSMSAWGSLIIATGIFMATLWFCTDAGFFGGLIPGVVLCAVGAVFLSRKPAEH
jgi:hypothetical protein